MSGIRFSPDLEAMRQRIAELERKRSVCQRDEELQAAQLRLIKFADDHTVIQLLQNFLDEAEKLTNSEIGFYHFVEADQKTLALQTWSTNTLAHLCNADGVSLHYPIEDAGVWVDCVRKRKPVVHNDYASLPYKKGLPEGHAPIVRELVVPVFRGEKIVAILGVGNKPTEYDEYDISTIQRLAVLAWETIDRKKAENALRESEAKLRGVFRVAPIGIGLIAERVFVDVNECFCELTGYARDELLGRNTKFLYSSDEDYQSVGEEQARLISEKGISAVETRFVRKDGEIIHVLLGSSPLDSADSTINFATTALDITGRVLTEAELARHRDQLEELVAERTTQLQEEMDKHRQILSLMAGREVRMAELKKAIKKLRNQLKDAGLEPIANDPLLEHNIS
ncbi:MAG: GAF domain-containing protein [Chloroflexi bacterium]|jgi:PAS domain S-box-containing protein|nr:GAF domain-containing protein [Chloroflexota bacterium]